MSSQTHIYSGELRERATSRDSLSKRLEINKRYQSIDFDDWLHKRLPVRPGEKILDVGCGTGAQALRFLKVIGNRGTVSALDISEESVCALLKSSGNDPRLEARVADMADLKRILCEEFSQKKFSLAQSAYALYYSPARMLVLQEMVDSLYDFGSIAIFTPVFPHGMLDIAGKFGDIDPAIIESLNFGPNILESEIRKRFWDVQIHYFQSEMRVSSIDDFMAFYRATTYYDEACSEKIRSYAMDVISSAGAVTYEKNGYLIIGTGKR